MIKRVFLDKLPFFRGFSKEEKEAISQLNGARFLKYQKGDPIVNEDDAGDSFFIILKGTLAVYKRGIGDEIATLKPGNLFGEVAFLSPRKRTTSVVCNNDVFLIEFHRSMLKELSFDVRDKIKDKLIMILIKHLDDLRSVMEENAGGPTKIAHENPFEKARERQAAGMNRVIYEGKDGMVITHLGGLKAKIEKGDNVKEVEMVKLNDKLPSNMMRALETKGLDPSEYYAGDGYLIPKAASRAWHQAMTAGAVQMREQQQQIDHFQNIDNLYS
ncbi:Crp/Fnr family transcriptional regulator [Magnetococcus sp. PR-3]|uniref:Crp/Fnr family transcriptional regulator n=1 Tax=Magnetococcus sp. PR-3 TaxID=3120355 RepID=UPI002FCE297E